MKKIVRIVRGKKMKLANPSPPPPRKRAKNWKREERKDEREKERGGEKKIIHQARSELTL